MYKWFDNKKVEVLCMRMKNKDVVWCFVNKMNGDVTNHSQSLRVEGTKLINYNTCIAQYIGGQLYVNSTRYSVTTSKLQTWLRTEARNYIELMNIPQDTYYLSKYVATLAPIHN